MKLIVTHPYCWPHVRRGSERYIQGLTRYMHGRGHEVAMLSTHPEGGRIENTEGGKRILFSPRSRPWMKHIRLDETHLFYFTARRALSEMQADAVHSVFYIDTVAATRTKPQHRGKVVMQLNGVAVGGVSCHRWFPPEGRLFAEAMRCSDVRIACSNFIREQGLEHYRQDSLFIPPPIDIDDFPFGPGATDRPTLLAVADFTVRRKGVRVLVKAFALVKQQVPDAVLLLSGRMTDELQSELLRDLPDQIRNDIRVLGLGKPGDVSRQYAAASVMVLPSMWEPSGGALLESLACGTPVVVANHGGVPEYVAPGTGVLFDPRSNGEETQNAEGLSDAILEALKLSELPETRGLCRAHAERHSWKALGPRYEAVYMPQSVSEAVHHAS